MLLIDRLFLKTQYKSLVMGVKGLWTILAPSSRAIRLESLAGKILAVDASIWLYQFLKALRDKDGSALRNAHIVGFFRRVCKLLFIGIKPVFVFDGGAPSLKLQTVKERRQRREGSATNLAKTAEKLLSAQLRAHAIGAVEQLTSPYHKQQSANAQIIDKETAQTIVYHDELTMEHTELLLKKRKRADEYDLPIPSSSTDSTKEDVRLPYLLEELEDVNVQSQVQLLAALRGGISDFDSQAFTDLSVEVQHELVRGAKDKSREPSYRRLASMIRSAPTALDFSKLQVQNLMNRNYLTQKLHRVTGFAGAGQEQRIASDRHRRYVFVKNDDGRGWKFTTQQEPDIPKQRHRIVISDKANPAFPLVGVEKILGVLNEEDQDDDDDALFEPVSSVGNQIPIEGNIIQHHHLLQGQEKEPLDVDTLRWSINLFNLKEDMQEFLALQLSLIPQNFATSYPEGEQFLIDIVRHWNVNRCQVQLVDCNGRADLARSLMDTGDPVICAMELENAIFLEEFLEEFIRLKTIQDTDFELEYNTESISVSQLSNTDTTASAKRRQFFADLDDDDHSQQIITTIPESTQSLQEEVIFGYSSSEKEQSPEKEEKIIDDSSCHTVVSSTLFANKSDNREQSISHNYTCSNLRPSVREKAKAALRNLSASLSSDTDEFEMVEVCQPNKTTLAAVESHCMVDESVELHHTVQESVEPHRIVQKSIESTEISSMKPIVNTIIKPTFTKDESKINSSDQQHLTSVLVSSNTNVNETLADSPALEISKMKRNHVSEESGIDEELNVDLQEEREAEYEAEEENEEFTRFLSKLSNKDFATVRSELDREINTLNQQQRKEKRDSDTVTIDMVRESQKLLQLFGIPFVVSPMEAEAQCAFLSQHGLVDGIVTDDSDVFLFGGTVVYKNMFNQSKYVERYTLEEIRCNLSLDRDSMIRLAYLLGSDYTEGLQGVGAVTAMEIIGEWQGDDGLIAFKRWVNSGAEISDKNSSEKSVRKHLAKKQYFVPNSFPDERVRTAYLHPQVDESLEKLQWGHPDVDGLRTYLGDMLHWSASKVDETVIPLLKHMNRMKKTGMQSSMDTFLATDSRGRTAKLKSKRMQHVIHRMQHDTNASSSSTTSKSKR